MADINQKFKTIIDSRGIKKTAVAKQLNMSRQVFSNKINGKTPFTVNEVLQLCDALDLSKKEKCNIFFAEKGN